MDLYVYQAIVDRGGYKLILTCKTLYHGIRFEKFGRDAKALTQEEIEPGPFPDLQELTVKMTDEHMNDSVYCVNHLRNLQVLTCKSTLVDFSSCHMLRVVRFHHRPVRSSAVKLITDAKVRHGFANMKMVDYEDGARHYVICRWDQRSAGKMEELSISAFPVDIEQECLNELNLTVLKISSSRQIVRVDHMTNLRVLHAPVTITQEQIDKLDLEELDASICTDIVSVNHMKRLKVLRVGLHSGITDEGIRGVNLESLDASWNSRITNVNHMSNLRELRAGYYCGITDEGLRGLTSLTLLHASRNPRITNVNHMGSLRELRACDNCGIADEGLRGVVSLECLHSDDNPNVTDVNHLGGTLRVLHAEGDSGITDEGLREVVSLTHLHVSCNPRITTVNHMSKLVLLDITGNCGVGNEGIKGCNPAKLYAGSNQKITDVSHATNLKVLRVGRTAITDDGIKNINPEVLLANGCGKITNVSHMTNLRKLCAASSSLTDEGIRGINPRTLDLAHCEKVTDISHMTNLRDVTISHTGVTNHGIRSISPAKLEAQYCEITDFNHMGPGPSGEREAPLRASQARRGKAKSPTNLRYLSIAGRKLRNESIRGIRPSILRMKDCAGITDISHMKVTEMDSNIGDRSTGLRVLQVNDEDMDLANFPW